MKKLRLVDWVIITVMAFAVLYAPATKATGDFLVIATSLCEYTKVNDRNAIRKTLKKGRLKIRRIYDDIKCNDLTLHAWALKNGATDVADYYAKKVKKNL